MKIRPLMTPSMREDADVADTARRNLLAALDDLSGALRALSPGGRPVDLADLMLARGRADAAAYYLGLTVGTIDTHNNRPGVK
jgi:hypothetical protein